MVTIGIDDWTKTYKAKKIICEMLVDRGFIVDNRDLQQGSDELKQRLGIIGNLILFPVPSCC